MGSGEGMFPSRGGNVWWGELWPLPRKTFFLQWLIQNFPVGGAGRRRRRDVRSRRHRRWGGSGKVQRKVRKGVYPSPEGVGFGLPPPQKIFYAKIMHFVRFWQLWRSVIFDLVEMLTIRPRHLPTRIFCSSWKSVNAPNLHQILAMCRGASRASLGQNFWRIQERDFEGAWFDPHISHR